jgi:hypothetical protein
MPPAKKKQGAQVNKIWANTSPTDTVEFITLPSGQTCYARRMGLEGIMKAGILGEADSLTAMVDRKHIKRVRDPKTKEVTEELNPSSVLKDAKALKDIVLLVDRAAPFIVTEPAVASHVEVLEDGSTRMIPPEERDESFVYTDQIPLEDKMFLFDYAVGGTRDVHTFRQQSSDAVAGVVDGEDVPAKAVRVAGNRAARRSRK